MIKKAKKTNSKIKSQINTGVLVLENKKVFKGIGIGYQGEATGEVCFNTSLTGYQEIISDPSYAGQIINFTFPHIGNVGTNKEDHESDKIWAKGVIVNSEITSPSNYRSFLHLDAWLKKNKIVGITGLDTRNLTNFSNYFRRTVMRVNNKLIWFVFIFWNFFCFSCHRLQHYYRLKSI